MVSYYTGNNYMSFLGVFVKLVLREEIRKLKITEFSSPYEEMIKFVDEQFSVCTKLRIITL